MFDIIVGIAKYFFMSTALIIAAAFVTLIALNIFR